MPTLTEMKKAFIHAFDEGDMEQAGKFQKAIEFEENRRESDPLYTASGAHMNDPDVPGYVSDEIPWLATPEPEKSLTGKAVDALGGAVEIPLSMATSAAGVPVGVANMAHQGVKSAVRGGTKGLDKYLRSRGPEEAFQSGVGAIAYQPRTDTGRKGVQALADVLAPLPPVIAPSITQAGMVGNVAKNVSPIARTMVVDPALRASRTGARRVGSAIGAGVNRAISATDTGRKELAKIIANRQRPQSKGLSSVGADQLPKSRLRAERARELDDPIDLTLGEATRNQDLLRFQHEQQKLESGKPFREAQSIKNQKVANNLDMWIDEAGSELVAIGDKGRHLDESLNAAMQKKSDMVNKTYREAEAAGHMSDQFELQKLTDFLNDPIKRAEAVNDGVLKTTRRVLLETGAAIEVDDIGPNRQPIKVLIPDKIDLVSGEQIRRSIGENASITASDRRQARLLKEAYDADTEGLGGDLYKRARSQRREFADQFENNELIRKLTGTNPKSGEKLIAIESMVDTILGPSSGLASVDRLKKLRTMLLKSESGRRSWREIQGELVQRIKSQTFRTKDTDENGNPIPSYSGLNKAISELDRSGKLDIILSKKGAEKMRTLRDVVQTIYTAPPGTINHSNTATVIASLLDGAVFAHGVPVPIGNATRIAVKKIKDRQLRKKIEQHLRGVL